MDAEPEVPIVPVEPLALNELLPEPEVPVVPFTPDELPFTEVESVLEVPVVPLFVELELFQVPEPEVPVVPVVLSPLVGFTALFIPVVLFLDESRLRDP